MKRNTTELDEPIRVIALVPYPAETTPSQRFRIEQWMPYLADLGIQVDLIPFADQRLMSLLPLPGRQLKKAAALSAAFLRTASRIGEAYRYDVVFIHRAVSIVGPAALERLIPLMRRPIIFDFDDAIYRLHTTRANRFFGWLKFPGKTKTICRLSNHVVVGNHYLADYARQFNPNVTVVATSVDTQRYQVVPREGEPKRIVIGWSGSSTSQTYLESFVPVLAPILADLDAEFRVVSNRRPDLGSISFDWRPWSPETEVQEIAQFDIGIMPMPDEEWALGKCALKALQYMAVGAAPVCSALGANCEVIRHGQNGFLATTPDDWRASLQELVCDSALRRRLGSAARETVEQDFSMTRCASRFAQVVRQTLAQSQERRRDLVSVNVGEFPPT